MQHELFKDLKIVELASVLAGPSVGMFFAELGAQVIKFENKKTQGDVTRNWRTKSEPKDGPSAYFSSINWGKEHALVNYGNSNDLASVHQTIEGADIVISNFKKGADAKFQLDYDHIKTLNSKIIYAQLDGFSSNEDRVAFDVVLQAECGYMFMNGQKDSPPTKMPLALMDVLAGHQMKEAILIALLKKAKTNQGSYINCSLEKSAIASLVNQASNYLMANHIPQRIGSLHPNIAPYGETFKTKDNSYIVFAIGSDKQFEKLCALIKENWYKNPNFSTNQNRVNNRQSLGSLLKEKVSQLNSDEFVHMCIEQQIPVGRVRNMKEVFENTTAQEMVLSSPIEGSITKRVKSIAFEIS